MIIEKIDIKSFGLIRDMTLEFERGINIIEGQNEAGKSTIAAFIRYMLFGFDAQQTEGVLSERQKRINWETGVAQGSMIVLVDDKRYLISRSTAPVTDASGRMTYKEESSIIDLESGATAFGKIPAGDVFLSVTKDLFENTAFVGQIGKSDIDEEEVKQSIENILFSASESLNNQRAMARIRDKMEGLVHRSGQGGTIYELTTKQQEMQRSLDACAESTKQILAKESELYRVRLDRADAEGKLEKFYELDAAYTNLMYIQTFETLHELEEECEEKTAAYNAYVADNTHAGYVPTEAYLTDIAVARRAVNDSYHALREAEARYDEERGAVGITKEIEGYIQTADTKGGEATLLEEGKGYHGGMIRDLALGIISSLGVVAAVVYQLVASGSIGELLYRIIFGAVGVLMLAGSIGFTVSAFKNKASAEALYKQFGVDNYTDFKGKMALISQSRAKRDAMTRAIESAKLSADKARERYDEAKAELTRVIVRWGETPPTSSLNDFLDNLETRVSAFLERRRLLLEEKNTIELTVREIRHSLSDKNEIDIRAQVSPIKRKTLSVINHDEIVTGIATLKSMIADFDKRIFAIESELVTLRARSGDPAEIYTKIKALEEKIADLRARHKAYFIAHKTIESATDNLRSRISPRLGEYATSLMGIMTDRKYTGFDVNGGLQVSYTDQSGVQRRVDFLSGGTRDLAYIAVRMALIDMLYTEKPPVVFDESFAHQDNLRARSMMKALKFLADDGYQSFVFTCRGREATLAKEIDSSSRVFKLSVGIDESL